MDRIEPATGHHDPPGGTGSVEVLERHDLRAEVLHAAMVAAYGPAQDRMTF